MGAKNMKPKIIEKEAIKIIGIEVRTNNKVEMSGQGKISQQWKTFYKEKVLSQIPKKKNPDLVLAVYTDYESDMNGEFSFIIGTEVTDDAEVPEGLTSRRIPSSKYALFSSEKGPIPDIIISIWKHIWSLKPNDIGGNRAYKTDFELYDERSKNPKNAQVDVYLSIQ